MIGWLAYRESNRVVPVADSQCERVWNRAEGQQVSHGVANRFERASLCLWKAVVITDTGLPGGLQPLAGEMPLKGQEKDGEALELDGSLLALTDGDAPELPGWL